MWSSLPSLLQARSKLHALGAAVGHVPGRLSMGRTRWEVLQQGGGGGGDLAAGVRQLSPEAREVASRTYVAGGPQRWPLQGLAASGPSRRRMGASGVHAGARHCEQCS